MAKESAYFIIENLKGKHSMKDIKQELGSAPGVISVAVNTETHRVAIDFDSTGTDQKQLETALENIGYRITDETLEQHIM
ncbi:MAG: hypothetical protein BGN88_13335 [Clostridiales bacterium 43-6]|nr:MAG: hypothetical protein BGN88_13335 [Clostridiales bacterium 43-6]